MVMEKKRRKGLSASLGTVLFVLLLALPFGLHLATQSGSGWAQAVMAGAIIFCMAVLVWLG